VHVGSLCIGFVIGKRTVRDKQISGKAMQLCSALMQGISILLASGSILLASGKQSLSRPVFQWICFCLKKLKRLPNILMMIL